MKLSVNQTLHALRRHALALVASAVSITATTYFYRTGTTLSYGDAESHINIAKRVIGGLPAGFGQLGGVWLPAQHLLMLPFVWNDFLWRSGLGGSIVSMVAYVISTVIIYRIVKLLDGTELMAWGAATIFALNPNILYLQSTPMGDVPLIASVLLSVYLLIKWMKFKVLGALVGSAIFAAVASLMRYDGWFLIPFESLAIIAFLLIRYKSQKRAEGIFLVHATVAYLGIAFWLIWNLAIFGNAIGFLGGAYSAHAQQQNFLAQGQLQTYHNLLVSIKTYVLASIANAGIVVFALGVAGTLAVAWTAIKQKNFLRLSSLLLITPLVFYVFSLVIGSAIIVVPGAVPAGFGWNLYNVRYGLMMLPALSIFAVMFVPKKQTMALAIIIVASLSGYALMVSTRQVATYQEGVHGITSRTLPGPTPAEVWFSRHYTSGLVMINTYGHASTDTLNLNVPMNKIIYEGSFRYWDESLTRPATYASWIILRQVPSDPIWSKLKGNSQFDGSFEQVYRSGDSAIYERRIGL